jgi:seryl-tRNA synthetase
MHDIKAIRETPEAYDYGWAKRGMSAQTPAILEWDQSLRTRQKEQQDLLARRNEVSKLVGQAKAKKDEAEAEAQLLMAEVHQLKERMDDLDREVDVAKAGLQTVLAALPNIPDASVPRGADEHGNVEERRWGVAPTMNSAKDHVALGEGLGLMDFEAAARTSGSRFVFLKGDLARLERALGAFMLDIQTREHDYLEVSPPLLVRDEAVFGTGQLPKFAEDLFRTTDGRWLIPTAEVSLTNMVMQQILDEPTLPLRLTALTPSFRSEAGASGKDTRGMIRQHQFYKVELVSITTPDQSDAEHERMTGCAEAILQRLELPYRTMLLCAGDMGFSARKTYDLEVWMPSQGVYREISSCSNCGDFQARRMDARFRVPGVKGAQYLHTLNGSGLAVGRTLVAVLENYQDEGGRIAIPPALQPYMSGQTHIGPA